MLASAHSQLERICHGREVTARLTNYSQKRPTHPNMLSVHSTDDIRISQFVENLKDLSTSELSSLLELAADLCFYAQSHKKSHQILILAQSHREQPPKKTSGVVM